MLGIVISASAIERWLLRRATTRQRYCEGTEDVSQEPYSVISRHSGRLGVIFVTSLWSRTWEYKNKRASKWTAAHQSLNCSLCGRESLCSNELQMKESMMRSIWDVLIPPDDWNTTSPPLPSCYERHVSKLCMRNWHNDCRWWYHLFVVLLKTEVSVKQKRHPFSEYSFLGKTIVFQGYCNLRRMLHTVQVIFRGSTLFVLKRFILKVSS